MRDHVIWIKTLFATLVLWPLAREFNPGVLVCLHSLRIASSGGGES